MGFPPIRHENHDNGPVGRERERERERVSERERESESERENSTKEV